MSKLFKFQEGIQPCRSTTFFDDPFFAMREFFQSIFLWEGYIINPLLITFSFHIADMSKIMPKSVNLQSIQSYHIQKKASSEGTIVRSFTFDPSISYSSSKKLHSLFSQQSGNSISMKQVFQRAFNSCRFLQLLRIPSIKLKLWTFSTEVSLSKTHGIFVGEQLFTSSEPVRTKDTTSMQG